MPGRTATLLLERGAPNTVAPSFRSLISLASDAPRPRTLRVEARALVPDVSPEIQSALALAAGTCGVWWSRNLYGESNDLEPWRGGAALRLTFGSSPGIGRTIYCDLRPGEYALPPVEYLDVSVAYWWPVELQIDPLALGEGVGAQLEVGAEIVEGESLESTPFTCTCVRTFGADDGGTKKLFAPPGAYAFDVGADGQSIASLTVRGGVQLAVRRYDTGRWTPPTTPILLRDSWIEIVREHIEGDPDIEADSWTATACFFVR